MSVNTPDIREVWNSVAIGSAKQMPNTNLSTLTVSPVSNLNSDGFSTVGSSIGYDEDLQMDIALRNSMKESFKKSAFTPDGDHISELRAKRRLFQDSEKKQLNAKKEMYSSQKKGRKGVVYNLTHDSPRLPSPSGFTMPSNVSNRIHNNGLDPAYFMSTQQDSIASPPAIQTKTNSKVDSDWEQKLRIDIIRRMRTGTTDNVSVARTLYRVYTRREPKDKFADVESIARDCNNAGMTVAETVDLMMSMV